jgi:hypothetical protein
VPVNVVQTILGHEPASTTLDRYTHNLGGHGDRVRQVFGHLPRMDVGDGAGALPEMEA